MPPRFQIRAHKTNKTVRQTARKTVKHWSEFQAHGTEKARTVLVTSHAAAIRQDSQYHHFRILIPFRRGQGNGPDPSRQTQAYLSQPRI
jgi:hypothetical protein